MNPKSRSNNHKCASLLRFGALAVLSAAVSLCFCGCGGADGYSNESLFPAKIKSVYVEMFDNETFRRGVEYDLTDALAKRIESDTPYKIVSNRDKADTIISGRIAGANKSVLSIEREMGKGLEKEVEVQAVVNWKDLTTGELLIDNETISATASYSEFMNQGYRYGSSLAANNLARKIVELMEKKW